MIAVISAIVTVSFYFATYKIKMANDAEIKNLSNEVQNVRLILNGRIDSIMVVLTAKITRGQDKNKLQFGILSAEIYQIKRMVDREQTTIDLSILNDALPSEETEL